jgi:phosphatidylserine decarboxylase
MDDCLSSDGEAESDAEETEPGEVDPFSSSPLTATPAALESPSSSGLLTHSQSEPLPERPKPHRPSFIPKFHRRPSSTPIPPDSGTASDTTPVPLRGPPGSDNALKGKRRKFRKSWSAKKAEYNLSAGNDIMGIVMLEVNSAEDLPKLKNREPPICP